MIARTLADPEFAALLAEADRMPEVQRATEDAERRILRCELDLLLHLAGIDALTALGRETKGETP